VNKLSNETNTGSTISFVVCGLHLEGSRSWSALSIFVVGGVRLAGDGFALTLAVDHYWLG
jgi:hypothetical protein